MKIMRTPARLVCAIFVCAALCGAAAQSGSLSGVARDGQGQPLSGVHIALTGSTAQPSTSLTTSDAAGKYRFERLSIGDYTLTASCNGYGSTSSSAVRIGPQSMSTNADLTLHRVFSSTDAGTPASSRPALEFQSSGIRGLIDPGGYSASTGAGATTILQGIADFKRTNKSDRASAEKDWPCLLEPALVEEVAKHPAQADAYSRLGQFYGVHDQPGKAIPLLKQALDIDADDGRAARALAISLLETGDFENARGFLSSFAERHDDPEIRQLLARADEGSGMFQQAAQQYHMAAKKEASEESLFGLGYELILAGSVAEGAAAFEAGARYYPRSIPLRLGVGTAQFLLGNSSNALHNFLDAADIDPADPRVYPFLAAASDLSPNEGERVRDGFKRFLEREPDSASANYFYALALTREGTAANVGRIEMLLKRAIALDPNLAQAHLQLADTYAHREDYQDAVLEYEAAIRLDHDLSEAHYRLAIAYKRTGAADRSAQEMQVFRMSRQRQATANSGIDFAQFISVINASDQRANQETQCPDSPLGIDVN